MADLIDQSAALTGEFIETSYIANDQASGEITSIGDLGHVSLGALIGVLGQSGGQII